MVCPRLRKIFIQLIANDSTNRAGCNFSAISGSDANALKWDSAGYSHLMRLANNDSEASYVKRTPSIEMWDEDIPENKIKDMSKYLEDVSGRNGLIT